MQYISTRGQSGALTFSDVLLTGLAPDGGLFVPETWPTIAPERIRAFASLPYAQVATEVLLPFVGKDIPEADLYDMCQKAYSSFHHAAVTPVKQIGPDSWVLELFHGPTLAFKDVAMQLLALLFDYVLRRRGQKMTIVGATSGDTGGAAIHALKNCAAVDVFILHPHQRISDVQRRIMTCVDDPHMHNIAITGSFDDCQSMVKAMFAQEAFRKNVRLGAINSINWARIMAQTVYYFTAGAALGAPDRVLSYVVPTGNFGDIFAGFVAKKMGLPLSKLCVATNQNDILDRVMRGGAYMPSHVQQTISPSMDIQVSSNFERLLFEAGGRNAAQIRQMMDNLHQSGHFSLSTPLLQQIGKHFLSAKATEAQTAAMMTTLQTTTGEIVDPHTAVGFVAMEQLRREGHLQGPAIVLATAHPAKFPNAVKSATQKYPELPSWLHCLFEKPEQYDVLGVDQPAVERYILQHTRAA